MIYLLLTLNGLLMVVTPFVVARLLRRYHLIPWRLWGIGAAAFVLSQFGHIPFNNWVGSWWQPDITTQLVPYALFLGLSAGVFEEVTRYLVFRFWAKEARSWGEGLMVGAGHGGIEAIILGTLFFLQFANVVFYRAGLLDNALATVPAEQITLLKSVAAAMLSSSWYDALLGGVERIFAICFHLSASLMVLRSLTHRQPLWLAAAILWHTLTNAGSLYLVQTVSPYAAEGFLLFVALASLGFIFAIRTPEPEPPPPEPPPPPQPVILQPMALDGGKLDERRYGGGGGF